MRTLALLATLITAITSEASSSLASTEPTLTAAAFYPGYVEHRMSSLDNLKHGIKDLSHSLNKLDKTLKGIVYTVSTERIYATDMPNAWGPIVKIGIPPPTGTMALGGYQYPQKDYAKFFAKEVNNKMAAIAEEKSNFPTRVWGDHQLNTYLARINTALTRLEDSDKSIQVIASSIQDPTISNLAIGKQAIMMSDAIANLKDELKKCDDYLDNGLRNSYQISTHSNVPL